MTMASYKRCSVPKCQTSTTKCPEKLFIHVPRRRDRRNHWLKLAGRDPESVSEKSTIYFCEDHFDLLNDMENYMLRKVMGSISNIRLKPNCLPSKFDCQQDQRIRVCTSMSTLPLTKMYNLETTKIEDLDEPTTTARSDLELTADASFEPGAVIKEEIMDPLQNCIEDTLDTDMGETIEVKDKPTGWQFIENEPEAVGNVVIENNVVDKMTMTSYKHCAVPMCGNTTTKCPEKLFIHVSKRRDRRNQWLKLAGRDPESVSEKSTIFFCEDHFDLPNDMDYYMQRKVMGSVGLIRLKPNCMPSKFDCQQNHRTEVLPLIKMDKRKLKDNIETIKVEDLNGPSTSATTSNFELAADASVEPGAVLKEEIVDPLQNNIDDKQYTADMEEGTIKEPIEWQFIDVDEAGDVENVVENSVDKMTTIPYKRCAVPKCGNSTTKCHDKLFLHVPRRLDRRNHWLKLASKDPESVSEKSTIYFCEDHFDMPNDIINYMQYKVMGSVGNILQKPGCLPSKFDCQQNHRTIMSNSMRTLPSTNMGKIKLNNNSETMKIGDLDEPSISGTANLTAGTSSNHGAVIKEENMDLCQNGTDSLSDTTTGIDEIVQVKPFTDIKVEPKDVEEDRRVKETENWQYICLKEECSLDSEAEGVDGRREKWQDICLKERSLDSEEDVEKDRRGKETENQDTCLKEECSSEPEAEYVEEDRREKEIENWQDICIKMEYSSDSEAEDVENDRRGKEPENQDICLKKECSSDSEAEDVDEDRREKEIENWQDILVKEEQELTGTLKGYEEVLPGAMDVDVKERESLLPNASPAVTREPQTLASDTGAPKCNACGASPGHKAIHRHSHGCRRRRSKNPITCKICSKKFLYYCTLDQHLRGHTEEKPYSCKICTSKQPTAMTRSTKNPYPCQSCEKSFTCTETLKKHEFQHSVEKPYSCDKCKKEFSRVEYLKRHSIVHNDDRPYSCDICQQNFKCASTRNRHLLLHIGENPYACKKCDKEFGTSSDLKKHDLVHTGVRPYACTVCGLAYRDLSSLVRHKEKHATAK